MICCISECFSCAIPKNTNNNAILFSTVCLYFLLSIILLYPSHSFASGFRLDVGPDGISGYSDNAPLKDILSDLSGKTGYRIYLNDKLSNAKTSFFIANKISHEKAVKLIIQPHSNIMIFGLNDKKEHYISDIKVYPRSGKSGKYLPIHNNTRAASYSGSGSSSYNSNSYNKFSGIASNDYGRSLPEKYNNKIYNIEKSAFGTPVTKKKEPLRGPGRSLTGSEMKKAYEKYVLEKERYDHRASSAQSREGYLKAQKEKKEYIARRQQAYDRMARNNKDNN